MRDIEKHKKRKAEWYQRNKQLTIQRSNDRRNQQKKWLEEYKKTLKCEVCVEDRWYCLDFHHIDPAKKELGISRMASQGCSIKKILEEIKKCKVLCANCHRDLHYNKNGGFKNAVKFL